MGTPKKKEHGGVKAPSVGTPTPAAREVAEDKADAEAARHVKSTGEKPIPWEQAEKELDALP